MVTGELLPKTATRNAVDSEMSPMGLLQHRVFTQSNAKFLGVITTIVM